MTYSDDEFMKTIILFLKAINCYFWLQNYLICAKKSMHVEVIDALLYISEISILEPTQ